VFSSPGLSAYSGSIVSSPTVFPFASGIGLMGEAGAEAIMPLKRGKDGKLGIAGGGSTVIVNIIESPDKGGQTNMRNEGGESILDVFVDKVKSSISRDISRGDGIAIPLERRYALNPAAGAMR
jgi:phage-related minor tail protein